MAIADIRRLCRSSSGSHVSGPEPASAVLPLPPEEPGDQIALPVEEPDLRPAVLPFVKVQKVSMKSTAKSVRGPVEVAALLDGQAIGLGSNPLLVSRRSLLPG